MSMKKRKISTIFAIVLAASLALSACVSPTQLPAPAPDQSQMETAVAETVVAELTKSAPSVPEAPPATAAPQPTAAAPQATAAPPQAPPPGATPDPNIPVAVIPTAAPGEPGAIANYNTTIMSGPGYNYVVYAVFVGSATAKVVGKSEDGLWWAVSVPPAPGGSGWVDAAWVTVANADSVPVLPTPPVPPTTELIPPAPEDPQVTTLVNTYVRTGPGANFPAYGVASAGVTGRVIGKSEDGLWWVVRLNPEQVGDGYGWVEAQYTSAVNVDGVQTIETPGTAEPVSAAPPPEGVPTAMAIDYVNVRSGPGTTYLIYGVASPGTTGEVSGKSADGAWWQVKISTQYAPDGLGWVSADWVITEGTESTAVVEVAAGSAARACHPSTANQLRGLHAGRTESGGWDCLWRWDAVQHHLGAAEYRHAEVGPERIRPELRGRGVRRAHAHRPGSVRSCQYGRAGLDLQLQRADAGAVRTRVIW